MLKRRKPTPKPVATETRAVELLTHVWMLSVVTVFGCEMLAALAALVVRAFGPEAVTLELFAGFMLFAALVVGAMSLVMLPLVLWMRTVAPPRGVVVFAVVAGFAPYLVLLLRAIS